MSFRGFVRRRRKRVKEENTKIKFQTTYLSAFSTAEEHEEQCMPWIESCCGDGWLEEQKREKVQVFFSFRVRHRQFLSDHFPYLCLRRAALRGLFPRREQATKLRRHVLIVGVVLRRRSGPAPGHFELFFSTVLMQTRFSGVRLSTRACS